MSDSQFVAVTSAARTATGNSGAFDSPADARGVLLTLSITVASGTTPTLDIKVRRVDALGIAVDLPSGAFAQKTATGTDDLIIYPGVAETANRSVSDCIGDSWQIVWTIGGTTPSFTFSIGATYIR